jgi:uncharacterized membrane protein YecN with MAPEG domain
VPVTALYASLLACLFVALSVRVIFMRGRARVPLGDGGDAELRRRMRVHANFAEYAPFALLLLALAESLQAPAWALHLIGLSLFAGRCAHAYGVSRAKENFRFRTAGMGLTFAAILSAAVACFAASAARGFGL